MTRMIIEIAHGHYCHIGALQAAKFVIDAGGCVGEFSVALRRAGYTGVIHLIEPAISNMAAVVVLDDPSIVRYQKALVGSNWVGPAIYTRYPPKEWGNILGLYDNRKEVLERYEVETMTLDEITKLADRVDFLKMDVEGTEFDVLTTLSVGEVRKIREISVEVHPPSRTPEMVELLTSLGFHSKAIDCPNADEVYGYRED